jgi:hypothetical protein
MEAYCEKCGKKVFPAPSRYEGEDTYCGWYPCPDHPNANVISKTSQGEGCTLGCTINFVVGGHHKYCDCPCHAYKKGPLN